MRAVLLKKLALATLASIWPAILLSQFCVAFLRLPGIFLYACPSGLGIEYRNSLRFAFQHFPLQKSIPFDLFAPPSLYTANISDPGVFLPWWLILALLATTTLLIRPRTDRLTHGFPLTPPTH